MNYIVGIFPLEDFALEKLTSILEKKNEPAGDFNLLFFLLLLIFYRLML